MKSVKIIILLLAFPFIVSAQDSPYMDSLRYELENTKNDTIKMDIYRKMGFYLQNGKVDSALYYHQKQLVYAQKLNMKLYEADAHQQIAYVLLWQMDLPKAMENYNKALKIANDPNSAENGWGYANFSFSESPADARLSIIGMVHYELSNLYNTAQMFDEEKLQLLEALKMGKKLNNKKILSLSTRDLGLYYASINLPDSALYYYRKSFFYYKNSPFQVGIGNLYQNISQIYEARQQYDSTKFYLRKAIPVNYYANEMIGLTYVYLDLGRISNFTGQPDSALYYTLKSISVAKSIKSETGLAAGYTQLSAIYKFLGKPELALGYLEKGKAINDSISKAYVNKLTQMQNDGFQEQLRLKKIADDQTAYQNRMKMISLIVVLAIILIIALLLYRNNRQRRKTNKVLKQTLANLKATQNQLVHAEKMASLGELTAGIAHEIQNPLNFINNFSEVNAELITELTVGIDRGDIEEVKAIARNIGQNELMISQHGKRADSIVKGMLHHSRKSTGEKKAIDLNKMVDEYLRLSYHGLKAKDKSFNAEFKLEADETLSKVKVIPEDFGRVLLNLINNAFYAVSEKAKRNIDGYKPDVSVFTKLVDNTAEIRIVDNGIGIPNEIRNKIFQPFFTTKPTGQGTGLGLSMSYDIITKGHGGKLTVESVEGKGTEFSISLPF